MVHTAAIITDHSGDAIRAILDVHLPAGGLIADITFGRGIFWKKVDTSTASFLVEYDVVSSDIEREADVRADFRALPYRDGIFDCVFFDPPWGMLSTTGGTRPEIQDAYNLKSEKQANIFDLYSMGMEESCRVLKPLGLLVCKCQDFINQRVKHWLTWHIHETGALLGMISDDALIQVNPRKPIMRHNFQKHFRSNYSTYILLRKK